jgi:hypothetical protein
VAAQLVVIWWRDIPTQVNAQVGRARYQAVLPRRFQRTVDEAATAAGLTQASDYVAEWQRRSEPLADGLSPDELQAAADDAAARFVADYSRERLGAIAANSGIDPVRATP